MSDATAIDRPNVFEIDLDAVTRCVHRVRAVIGDSTYFFATLKANAYGYGLMPVARTVIAAGADAISLVSVADAVRLRESGVKVPIMVYAGAIPGEALVRAAESYDLIPTLHSDEMLQAFTRFARKRIKVAVKLEVGPERIGVPAEDAVRYARAIVACPRLELHVVNAHPNVTATGRAAEALDWQFQRFNAACSALAAAGIAVPYKVVASSKVLRLAGAAMLLNAVDPGAALFSPLTPDDAPDDFQPFLALKSRLIQVRAVTRTEYLDEAAFKVRPGMRIGIMPIGYSDGAQRLHCGAALVRGARAPLLAAPALEYTRLDLTDIPQAAVGDEVVIIGSQGSGRIDPAEVVAYQKASRVADLALEIRPSIQRSYRETATHPAQEGAHAHA